MKRPLFWSFLAAFMSFHSFAFGADGPPTEFAGEGTWKEPTLATVREQVNAWLATTHPSDDVRASIDQVWNNTNDSLDGDELLDQTIEAVSLADSRVAELATLCSAPKQMPSLPEFAWLAEEATPPFVRYNARLYFGRWLIRNRLFDEAVIQLEGLEPEQVVDPAGLLFYQAIAYQRVLKPEPGLNAINRLLEKPTDIPKRYASLAKLLQADLTQLKQDSLDHIARRMDDVTRRLDLGRAGPKTREVEDGVIKSLDKLIKEMEDAAAAAAAAAAAQNNLRPSSPAKDSTPMGGLAPGKVASKDVGNKSGWGELPPKERQEALQEIGKDFPAHYRDMIEEYFKKIASEESQP